MVSLHTPRLRTPVVYALIAIALLGIALYLSGETAAPLVPLLLAGAAVVMVAAAIVTWWDWFTWRRLEIERERRQNDAITPRYQIITAAAKLTPEQASVVGDAEFIAALGTAGGTDGPQYFLITDSGNVPIEFVDDFLRQCGAVSLVPVRRYSDGTPGREYARAVTDWCVRMGLATPDNGPKPAQWVTDQARARAFRLVGLELEIKE